MDPSQIRVLVVDDDDLVREVVVGYLNSFGLIDVIQIGDSTKALNYMQSAKNRVDLVLSDWEMPDLSGLELLKSLRKNPQRKDTKFIMITSQKSMEKLKIQKAAHWKVNNYLIKPFRAEVLKQRIWQVMGWDEKDEVSNTG